MEKKLISAEEFEKKVEIELEYLVYYDRLDRDEARKQAMQTVSEKYRIQYAT